MFDKIYYFTLLFYDFKNGGMLINRLFAKTPSQTLKSKKIEIEIIEREERRLCKILPHPDWQQNSPRSASHPSRLHRGCLPEIDSPNQ